MQGGRTMKKTFAVSVCILALLALGACGKYTVGSRIKNGDITEFYYTIDSSTNPPEFQRYHFGVEDGKHIFYHEKREGDHWPLTEADVSVSGTYELTDDEWNEFLGYLEDGEVQKRQDNADSGGRGPWLYLYWKGDKSEIQEFTFASYDREKAFVEFCESIRYRWQKGVENEN